MISTFSGQQVGGVLHTNKQHYNQDGIPIGSVDTANILNKTRQCFYNNTLQHDIKDY